MKMKHDIDDERELTQITLIYCIAEIAIYLFAAIRLRLSF